MSNWYLKEFGLIGAAVILSVGVIFAYDRISSSPKESPMFHWDVPKGAAETSAIKTPTVSTVTPTTAASAGPSVRQGQAQVLPEAGATWNSQVAKFLDIDGNPAWPVQGLALWTTCTAMSKSKASAAPPALEDLCDRMAGNGVTFVRNHLQGPSRSVALLVADELRQAHGLLSPRQLIDIDPRVNKAAAAKPASAA